MELTITHQQYLRGLQLKSLLRTLQCAWNSVEHLRWTWREELPVVLASGHAAVSLLKRTRYFERVEYWCTSKGILASDPQVWIVSWKNKRPVWTRGEFRKPSSDSIDDITRVARRNRKTSSDNVDVRCQTNLGLGRIGRLKYNNNLKSKYKLMYGN